MQKKLDLTLRSTDSGRTANGHFTIKGRIWVLDCSWLETGQIVNHSSFGPLQPAVVYTQSTIEQGASFKKIMPGLQRRGNISESFLLSQQKRMLWTAQQMFLWWNKKNLPIFRSFGHAPKRKISTLGSEIWLFWSYDLGGSAWATSWEKLSFKICNRVLVTTEPVFGDRN